MVNSDDFIKRLEQILDYYSLSASGFADKIGVQRSSLSHLLSGRNKPSLDFIMKILEIFPEVDLYWILNGKGNFPKTDNHKIQKIEPQKTAIPTTPFEEISENDNLFSEVKNTTEDTIFESKKIVSEQNISVLKQKEEIEKIVIFYKNGTFSEHIPK